MKGMRRRTPVSVLAGWLTFVLTAAAVAACAVPAYRAAYAGSGGNAWAAVGAAAGVCAVLGAVFYTIDFLRHRYMTEVPVRRILAATERMMRGDFDIKLEPLHEWGKYDEFDIIAENINRMAAELSQTETLRADFISDVSHEIKTPVAVIRTYASALKDGGLGAEEREEYVRTLLAASERLGKLVSDVLKLNKLENQKLLPEVKEFDLSESLTGCVLAYADAADGKGIELECDIPDGIRLASDGGLCEIIWNNLLSNAVKFTDKGGKITVRLSRCARGAQVEIADSGCGMDRETGRRIFDKFYQGDKSRSGEGNGLGLALVKRAIDMLGGDIRVVSAPGEGSRFTVTLRTDGK